MLPGGWGVRSGTLSRHWLQPPGTQWPARCGGEAVGQQGTAHSTSCWLCPPQRAHQWRRWGRPGQQFGNRLAALQQVSLGKPVPSPPLPGFVPAPRPVAPLSPGCPVGCRAGWCLSSAFGKGGISLSPGPGSLLCLDRVAPRVPSVGKHAGAQRQRRGCQRRGPAELCPLPPTPRRCPRCLNLGPDSQAGSQ